jgi:hypothetical protein
MDRGVPTEEVLAEMRAADPPVHYLVGTPKGRLTRLEKHLVAKPWQEARPGVQVKLLAQEGELYEQDLIPVRSFLTPRRPTGWTRSRSASMPIPHGRNEARPDDKDFCELAPPSNATLNVRSGKRIDSQAEVDRKRLA